MRSLAFAALFLALAACNRGDGAEELAGGTNELSAAQIDAALGPVDQSGFEDAATLDRNQDELIANGGGNALSKGPDGNATSTGPANGAPAPQEEPR